MRLSHYFLPVLKEVPSDAQVASHRLMLRAGLICQETAGIYSWLPLGSVVLKKIEQIIREEHDKAGCLEVIMPIVQTADLWRESGRYDAYGKEMLRFKDRHERDLLFGPTAEEIIVDIVRRHVKSYHDMPRCFYQFQWKFRDEIRPRFGVMRGREFLMKDAYSFDLDKESAVRTYKKMMRVYLNTFKRLGIVGIPVRAETGPIGGDLSHEFHVLADTGESRIFYDAQYDTLRDNIDTADVETIMKLYAMADDMHDPAVCPLTPDQLREARGIEVGHIFYYGTKYSDSMKGTVMDANGRQIPLEGGCYGMGVSRLMGAIIEANHDENGIIWPESVAPFHVALINLKVKDPVCAERADRLYQQCQTAGLSVLYDDTDQGAGAKFATMDLIGLPWQVVLGPKGVASGTAEVKNRRTGARHEMSIEEVVAFLKTPRAPRSSL